MRYAVYRGRRLKRSNARLHDDPHDCGGTRYSDHGRELHRSRARRPAHLPYSSATCVGQWSTTFCAIPGCGRISGSKQPMHNNGEHCSTAAPRRVTAVVRSWNGVGSPGPTPLQTVRVGTNGGRMDRGLWPHDRRIARSSFRLAACLLRPTRSEQPRRRRGRAATNQPMFHPRFLAQHTDLGKLVRQVQTDIADFQLGMADASVRHRNAATFTHAQNIRIESERRGGIVDGNVWNQTWARSNRVNRGHQALGGWSFAYPPSFRLARMLPNKRERLRGTDERGLDVTVGVSSWTETPS